MRGSNDDRTCIIVPICLNATEGGRLEKPVLFQLYDWLEIYNVICGGATSVYGFKPDRYPNRLLFASFPGCPFFTMSPKNPEPTPEKGTLTQQPWHLEAGVVPSNNWSADSSSATDVTTPPDGGYGWICVLAQFFVNGFTWGIVACYSIYLVYYLENDVYPDGDTTDFAFIGGLNFSIAVLMAPPSTILMRFLRGPRPVMAIGVMALPAGFIGASFSTRIWHLYLSQGICVGAGVGLIYMPANTIIPQWFSRRRSLANGICSAGSGIGGLAMCFATQTMLDSIGLQWSLRITAVIAFFVNLAATLLMRSRNAEIKPVLKLFDFSLLRHYHVLLLLAWAFVVMFGYITLMFSMSDYGRAIGLSSSNASLVSALLNLGAAFGRPCIGFASDRFGRIQVAGILTFACTGLIFALWIPATSMAPLLVFALSSGAILGIFWSLISPLAAEIGGLSNLPCLLSLVWTSIAIPTTFAEVIALRLRVPGLGARSYLYPQIFAGLSYFVASLIMIELWRAWRHRLRRQDSQATLTHKSA